MTKAQSAYGRFGGLFLAACAAAMLWVGMHGVPAQAADQDDGDIVVTLLGTGTPSLNPHRYSYSTLVQAGGLNLLIDAGRGAAIRLGQAGVNPADVDGIFFTHLHSDHLVGLSDVWMTGYIPALHGRTTPLEFYGPPGIRHIAEGLMDTFKADTDIREADEDVSPDGARIEAHEFPVKPKEKVFEKNGVKVTMFEVNHGKLIKPSVGYRVDYNGHSVAFSGDTRYFPNLIKQTKGVDVLVHEVAAMPDGLLKARPGLKAVMDHHINPKQAGEVFTKVDPKLAVYSHIVRLRGDKFPPPTVGEIARQTRQTYDGPLLVGEDLTRIVIGKSVTVLPLYSAKQ